MLVRDYLGMQRVASLPEANLSAEGTPRESLPGKDAAREKHSDIPSIQWKFAYAMGLQIDPENKRQSQNVEEGGRSLGL